MTANEVITQICATSGLTPDAVRLQIALMREAGHTVTDKLTQEEFFACFDGTFCATDIDTMNRAATGDRIALIRERAQWGLPKLKQP